MTAKNTYTKIPDQHDGIDRRDFLNCMAWAGTGLLWTFNGGVPTSRLFADTRSPAKGSFSFFQISDSHIGFSEPANMDVTATLKAAIDKVNVSQSNQQADLILHTGDVSHTSKPAQFDTAEQVIKGAKVDRVFYVPGEHDTSVDGGALYREHFGKGTRGGGWYGFDHKAVTHFSSTERAPSWPVCLAGRVVRHLDSSTPSR